MFEQLDAFDSGTKLNALDLVVPWTVTSAVLCITEIAFDSKTSPSALKVFFFVQANLTREWMKGGNNSSSSKAQESKILVHGK